MAAHYIDLSTQVKIHVMLTKAREAWVHGKHGHNFQQLVTIANQGPEHQRAHYDPEESVP